MWCGLLQERIAKEKAKKKKIGPKIEAKKQERQEQINSVYRELQEAGGRGSTAALPVLPCCPVSSVLTPCASAWARASPMSSSRPVAGPPREEYGCKGVGADLPLASAKPALPRQV